jgi:hypothetical protein
MLAASLVSTVSPDGKRAEHPKMQTPVLARMRKTKMTIAVIRILLV